MFQNNPLMNVVAAMRSGGNPAQFLGAMAQNNPQMAQAMQMIQGKSPAELREMAMNIARERGLDINEVARSLGISIPSQR